LWNWVSTAAHNAVRWLWNQISSGIETLKRRLSEGWSWISEKVRGFIDALKAFIRSGWEWIVDAIKGVITPIKTFLASRIDWVRERVSEALKGLGEKLKNILEHLKTALLKNIGERLKVFKRHLDRLWDKIGGIPGAVLSGVMAQIGDLLRGMGAALGETFKGFFNWILKRLIWIAQMVIGVVTGVMGAIRRPMATVTRNLIEGLTHAVTPGSPAPEIQTAVAVFAEAFRRRIEELTEAAYRSPVTPEALIAQASATMATCIGAEVAGEVGGTAADQAHPVKNIGFRNIVRGVIRAIGVWELVAAISLMPAREGLLTPLRYIYRERFTPFIPRSEELINMRIRGILMAEEYLTSMRKQGLDDDWSTKLETAAYWVPGFGELREMRWRDLIPKEKLIEALEFRGVRRDFVDPYLGLIERIPGPADLIRFVVREVIKPELFTELMIKQGYTAVTAGWFWDAHWVLPPPERTRIAFLRGRITEEAYKKFLVWYDYSPEPRPGIGVSDVEIMLETQYDLPGRIDARWLYRWGYIGVDGIADLLAKAGLHPEWVPQVAEAYAKVQLEPEIGRLITNAKADYRDGLITREVLEEDLRVLGIPEHEIPYHVADAEHDRVRRIKRDMLEYYEDAFLKDLITEDELLSYAGEIIIDKEALKWWFNRIWVRKYKKPPE